MKRRTPRPRPRRPPSVQRSGATHAVVRPARGPPGSRVQAVAAVDDDMSARERCGVGRIELMAVLVPLGDDDDGIRVLQCLVAVVNVGQLRVDTLRILDRRGVGEGDIGTQAVQANGDVEGGGVADVVTVRLEGGAQDVDLLLGDRIATLALYF